MRYIQTIPLQVILFLFTSIGIQSCTSHDSQAGDAEKGKAVSYDTSVVEPGRLLPKQLRYLAFGIIVEHYPNPCFPEKEDGRYVWKHNTTIKANKDMRIVEYGSFVYTEKGWYHRVANDVAFFDEHYGTKNGELKKDSVYTDPLSFRYGDTVYAGDAMWYYIAVDKEGNKYKGIGPIETEGITLQEFNRLKGLSAFSKSKSKFNWTGYGEIGDYALSGTLRLRDGRYKIVHDSLTVAHLEMDMQSLDGENKDVAEHLKGKDFFETGQYPVAIFELGQPMPLKNEMVLPGSITIKNISQPIAVKVSHSLNKGKHAFSGKLTLDRTKFNIKYNSKSFFSNLGDQAIKNTVDLTFEVIEE